MSVIEKPKGAPFDNGAMLPDGQYERYAVLPSGERKQFVRPYRCSYEHVGIRPRYPLRDLTEEEHARYDQYGYVKFEVYPDDSPEKAEHPSVTGRYWTEKQLASGCGVVTNMGQALSETYAADPTYYGATFCAGCGKHFPVEEFIWTADGQRVGS